MSIKAEAMAEIGKVAQDLMEFPFHEERIYYKWLAQTYYFVRHSTPMLALSAGRSVDNRAYHARCISHLAEEKGHEKMILNDLKLGGLSIEKFEENLTTQALYQVQYYWIEHVKPTSFLGYILLLEGIAVLAGQKAIARAADFKGKTFLKLHAEEDPDHLDKAFEAISALPEDEQVLVLKNLKLSAKLYQQMLYGCLA